MMAIFRWLRALIFVFTIGASLSLYAETGALHIGLGTGSTTGTYVEIGENLRDLLQTQKINLHVYESKGSLDNLAAVLERDEIHMGLVQSDVLGYLKESQNKKLQRIAEKIRMIFPLYNEEVHLLARKDIQSIQDLNHKVVAVGSKGSGTNLTSDLLFEIMDVWPRKKSFLDVRSSLLALENREVDALIYVSGYPVKLFEKIDSDRFHLVPISAAKTRDYYISSVIPQGAYSWQKNAVDTLAVKAVLMTVSFKDQSCENNQRIFKAVYENIGYLRSNGHPKWREVDLSQRLSGWDVAGCISVPLS